MFNVVAHALHRPQVARMTKRVGRRLRPIRPSRQAELWYLHRLVEAIDAMRARAKVVLKARAQQPLFVRDGAMDANPWVDALNELSRDKVFNSLKGQAELLARLAAKKARFWVDDRLAREVSRSLGVDVRAAMQSQGQVMTKMEAAVRWNVDLISTLPDRLKEDLEDKLAVAWAEGQRAKSIASMIDDAVDEAGEACEANAALIARDQMNKMNAAFNQARQTELGITKYQWRTSDDERVRSEHEAMMTLDVGYGPGVFAWEEDGPLEGTIDGRPCHPGEDIQCRCDAIPIFDLDALEAEAAAA